MAQHSETGTQSQADAADQRMTHEAGAACPSSSVVGGNRGFESRGALVSNTAPSNCTNPLSGTTVLRTGIDSLYVSCPGRISVEAENYLRLCKEFAQSEDPAIRAGAFWELAGHRFEVRDKGKGRYPYVLADNWFHIQISARSAKSLPMAYCQIRSEALTCEGFKPVMLRLVNILLELDPEAPTLNVSRVDLCADFVTGVDMGSEPQEAWVCRATKLNRYVEHGQFTGYQFGAGGALSARLYDKTREIQKSKKQFFADVWKVYGWAGDSKVWRLEFQIKREVLKELDVLTVGDLVNNLRSLWSYASGQWLQFKQPTSDGTCTRWPVQPLWSVLQAAPWDGIDRELWRVRTSREPDDHFLFINGLGVLSSFMAKEHLDDPDEAMRRYLSEARRFHQRKSKGKRNAMEVYLREKARLKATKFNRPLPGIEQGGEDAF